MKLLAWLEVALEQLAPNVSRIAGAVAGIASVMASLSWLVAQALYVIQKHRGIA